MPRVKRRVEDALFTVAGVYKVSEMVRHSEVNEQTVCPKCQSRNSMCVDRDYYGSYVECFQCGFHLDV